VILHVECGVLSVRQESAEIYFIGCNKYTVDKFAHTLKTRDEDDCGFFQQDGVANTQPLSPWSPYVILWGPNNTGQQISKLFFFVSAMNMLLICLFASMKLGKGHKKNYSALVLKLCYTVIFCEIG